MGFDHVALCLGAGKPTIIDMPNNLAPGVRQASDFLMALQLTGAARTDSLANLQLRLPVVVIGGGLTAIDTCTEALAYYPVQVEKFLARWETLAAERGEDAVRAGFAPARSGRSPRSSWPMPSAIRAERAAAKREGRAPRLIELLQSWGGATIAYRRRLIEVACLHAQSRGGGQGAGGRHPLRRAPVAGGRGDRFASARRRACASRMRTARRRPCPRRAFWSPPGPCPTRCWPARMRACISMAAISRPWTRTATRPSPRTLAKPAVPRVLMSVEGATHVSFFGDLHPSFAGNVVTAMASAKQGYPIVDRVADENGAAVDARRNVRAGQRRVARHRGAGRAPVADHRRGGGSGARRRARLPSRPVLSSAEFRDPSRRAPRTRSSPWKAWR